MQDRSRFLIDGMDLSILIPEYEVSKSWKTRRKRNDDNPSETSDREGVTITILKIKEPFLRIFLLSLYSATRSHMQSVVHVDPDEIIPVGDRYHTIKKQRLVYGKTKVFGKQNAYYVTARYPDRKISYKFMEKRLDITVGSGIVISGDLRDHTKNYLRTINYPLFAYEVSRQRNTLNRFMKYYRTLEAISKNTTR